MSKKVKATKKPGRIEYLNWTKPGSCCRYVLKCWTLRSMSAAGSIDDMSVTLTFTSRAGDWATAAEKTGAHAVAADGAAGVVDGSDTDGSGVRGRICANGVVAVVIVAAAPVGWRTDSETRGGSAARPDDNVDDDDDDEGTETGTDTGGREAETEETAGSGVAAVWLRDTAKPLLLERDCCFSRAWRTSGGETMVPAPGSESMTMQMLDLWWSRDELQLVLQVSKV